MFKNLKAIDREQVSEICGELANDELVVPSFVPLHVRMIKNTSRTFIKLLSPKDCHP